MKTETNAGQIGPSTRKYVVTNAHDHDDLKTGDVVVVVARPNLGNYLLRMADVTLHTLSDGQNQYVHLRPEDEA